MRQPQIEETELEKAQKLAAEEQLLEKTKARAGRETDQLYRRYGMSLRAAQFVA